MRKIIFILLAAWCIISCDEEEQLGGIYGVVTNKATGEPVVAGSVELQVNQSVLTRTVTGSDGHYEFKDLTSPMNYVVKVISDGYKTQEYSVRVEAGKTSNGDILLEVQPTELSVVTEAVSDIKGTSAAVVIRISYKIGYGYITGVNISTPKSGGFYYGTNSDPKKGTKVNAIVNLTTNTYGYCAQTLTGLTPNTTYYAQGFATNNIGTEYGNIVSFKTNDSDDFTVIGSLMVQFSDAGSANSYSTAVTVCSESRVGSFSNWRLPTLSELGVMYTNRKQIGGFLYDYYYWSSTSCKVTDSGYRSLMSFGNESHTDCSFNAHIRCVRTK